MNFDTKFPEFKQALGLSFAELKEDTKTALLAEWASRGDFEKLKASLTEIDVLKPLKALGEVSFSQWMLSHENEEMFDCWKELVNNHGVKMEGNAAVLSILMNKPERLKFLPKEEMATCPLPKMHKPVVSNILSIDETQTKLELIYGSSADKLSPISAAILMGFADLALSLSKERSIKSKFGDERTRLLIAQMGYKMPVEKMVELANILEVWGVEHSGYQRKYLFNSMLCNWDRSALEKLFKLVPDQIELLKERTFGNGVRGVLEILLRRGQLEKIEFLIEQKVFDAKELQLPNYDLKSLLDKNCEKSLVWLEENKFGISLFKDYKEWVFNKARTKKQGNALTFALIYGMEDLAKVLIKKGMTLDNAIVIDNHPVSKEESWYPEFSSRLEKFRLNEKVQTIVGQEIKEIKRKAL